MTMKNQEIYLSSSKHNCHNSDEIILEFENGSKIVSIDAKSINNVRGQRANIVWVDDKWMKLQTRKHIREWIESMKLKWYQKLAIEISFIWDDIKDLVLHKLYSRGGLK